MPFPCHLMFSISPGSVISSAILCHFCCHLMPFLAGLYEHHSLEFGINTHAHFLILPSIMHAFPATINLHTIVTVKHYAITYYGNCVAGMMAFGLYCKAQKGLLKLLKGQACVTFPSYTSHAQESSEYCYI